jgi:hypothetical protein
MTLHSVADGYHISVKYTAVIFVAEVKMDAVHSSKLFVPDYTWCGPRAKAENK